MRTKTVVSLPLLIFLLTFVVLNLDVSAAEERKVLSRNYVGLGVEVYAPYQCYPGENITVKVRVKALEDVKNASVSIFIWSSRSEGHDPWGTSFTVLDVTDFPSGAIKEEVYNITMPSDINSGLTYGILFLDWSIYRTPSWEPQWEKASFRATYVDNRAYKDLQTMYQSAIKDLQNTIALMYIFLATTIVSVFTTLYFARRKVRRL